MRVMISTVHIQKAVLAAIPKLSPEKIIFLVDADTKKEADVDAIRKLFGEIMPIEVLKIKSYRIPEVAAEVIKSIEKEHKAGNEIVVHITEGRKLTAIGAMYGAFARKEMVKGIYYITEEKNELISLPVLEIQMNATKGRILKEFAKGNTNVKKLAEQTDKSEAMMYAHITDLKNEGYIDAKDKLTDAGRIAIL